MKTKFNFFIFISLILVFSLSCDKKISKNRYKKFRKDFVILKQSNKKRVFSNNLLVLIKEVKFRNLKEEIYLPSYVAFDSSNNIYIFDRKRYKIHKLLFKKGFSKLEQKIFQNKSLRGKGPGEISRLLDFKIYNKRLYLLDEGTNTLIVYSDKGELMKNIKVKENRTLLFRKFTFSGDDPILCVYGNKDLFYRIDLNGKIIKSFGSYVDKNYSENILYHQYSVSKPVNNKCFYYLPLYLGFVGLYENGELKFVKETMDGRRFPTFIQEEIDGALVTRMKGVGFRTVSKYAITKKIILIKSLDMEKKVAYWDFYTVKNFNYIISIKNPPVSYCFDINGNYLVSANEDGIKIFNIESIIKRASQNL